MWSEIYAILFVLAAISLLGGFFSGKIMFLILSTALFGVIAFQSIQGFNFEIQFLKALTPMFNMMSWVLLAVSGLLTGWGLIGCARNKGRSDYG